MLLQVSVVHLFVRSFVRSKDSQFLPSESGVQVNITPCQDMNQESMMKDAQTQKDESDSSAEQITIIETQHRRRQSVPRGLGLDGGVCKRKTHRRFISKSKSPSRRNPYQTRVEPAISPDVDVYGILANVARTEGPFLCPEEALRAAIAAFTQDVWYVSIPNDDALFHRISSQDNESGSHACHLSTGCVSSVRPKSTTAHSSPGAGV